MINFTFNIRIYYYEYFKLNYEFIKHFKFQVFDF